MVGILEKDDRPESEVEEHGLDRHHFLWEILLAVLVTGGSGKLGREIIRHFPNSLSPTHGDLDLTIGEDVQEYIARQKPEMIFHCAALTNVRLCENDHSAAWATNVMGTINLLKACEKSAQETYFIYVSTACVFRGDRGNYKEDDIPYPKNFYALTKLIGEQVTLNSQLENTLVVRTNFVAKEKWPYPRAFVDRFGTYLFADDVARAISMVVEKRTMGVVHIVGDKKMSMYDLARLTSPETGPMSMVDYTGPPLTIDMSLVSTRLESFKITPTHS